ncbi:MAG: RNB domain-containing ribonuclease [Deltaproteobacteria bacterium]|nr:RNB domain-containing ribonuclease [Deltaproteobacteria bacterium]
MIDRDNNGIDDRIDLHEIAKKALLERDFIVETPPDAREQLRSLPTLGTAIRERDARDLTHLPWTSIDNEESKDLDQLEVAEELENGVFRLYVAISDVDCYAPLGSPVDHAAMQNSTSIYTAGGMFPMIDRSMSEAATSLLPGETRLSIVTEMDITPDGQVLRSAHYPAVVRNLAKLDYDRVGPWLEGRGEVPKRIAGDPMIEQQIRWHDKIAQALRQRRIDNGALGLDNSEPKTVRDASGRVIDVTYRKQNQANEVIESLMIATNQAVARSLDAAGYPTLRRAVKTPERWDRIVDLAAAYDFKLPPVASPSALAAFLRAIRIDKPEEFSAISLAVIKLVGRGEYLAKAPNGPKPGHFGLAIEDYAHTTAPNRRYPDVISQRLLLALHAGHNSPYSFDDLVRLGEHCSEREHSAKKVERKVQKSAAALLMADRVGDTFSAVVVGASSKGTWVRLKHPAVEGRLERGWHGKDVGDRFRVRLLSFDVDKGFLDFARV